jgi:twinkle protein
MATPEELNRLLSDRIEAVMGTHFPEATKRGASYKMGDLDGNAGQSTGVFRQRGGIYFAKDNATGDSVNILNLLHRKMAGSWADTMAEARKICGVTNVRPAFEAKKPAKPKERFSKLGDETPEFKYLSQDRQLSRDVLDKYCVKAHRRGSSSNKNFWAITFRDSVGDYVFAKSTGIEKNEKGKKDIWSTKPYATLWGWWLVNDNTKKICITEGEIDAMSIAQMGCKFPVLSMPSGSSNLDWIGNDFEALQQFEKIYLITDMDSSGEQAAQNISNRLGATRCFRVTLPEAYNDANEFLCSGKATKSKLDSLMREAATYDPETLIGVEDTVEAAIQRNNEMKEATKNRNFLFPALDFKLVNKDTGILTGMVGHGKTDFANCVMLNEMRQGEVVCIAAFDTPIDDLLRLCAWQMVMGEPDDHDIRLTAEALNGKLYFIDGVNNEIGSKSLLDDMDYAAKRFGCTRFLIDNLSEVADIRKDDYDAQDRFVRAVDKFDKKTGTNSMIVAHSLMSAEGCEWKIPGRRDVEGSKGMVKPIQYGLTMFRNKVKEKPEEYDDGDRTPKKIERLIDGSDTYFSVWKQRNGFRSEFVQGLRYDRNARVYAMQYEGGFRSPYPLQQEQTEVTIADLEDQDTSDVPF